MHFPNILVFLAPFKVLRQLAMNSILLQSSANNTSDTSNIWLCFGNCLFLGEKNAFWKEPTVCLCCRHRQEEFNNRAWLWVFRRGHQSSVSSLVRHKGNCGESMSFWELFRNKNNWMTNMERNNCMRHSSFNLKVAKSCFHLFYLALMTPDVLIAILANKLMMAK